MRCAEWTDERVIARGVDGREVMKNTKRNDTHITANMNKKFNTALIANITPLVTL